jgi:predicted porin
MNNSELRSLSALFCLSTSILILGYSGQAAAQTAPAKPQDDSLTWNGLTLYGTVDIGIAHLDHGAPLSATYGPGLPFLLQKFNNQPITSIAPNGLSQSRIGLSGVEPVGGDVSAVFKLETGFQPTSGQLTDGPKSLVLSNGVPLAEQRESGDSSRAGQPFNGAAWAGLQSKTFGTLTYGRQNSLILDDLQKYDPQQQAQAFSPIGYSGVAGGGGDTEDARLDQSLKYAVQYRFVRFAVLHQFGRADGLPGGSDQVDVGGDVAGNWGALSVDATYAHVSDAVSAAPLTAAQAAAAPGTLAGTISDNTTWTLQGKYGWKQVKFYAGYEHIELANPARPIDKGADTIGGYELSTVSNTAYTDPKIQQFYWVGVRYALTPRIDLSGAYYRNEQNSYKGNGCTDRSASSCAGAHNEASLVADYKLTKHFDVYAGLNYSAASGGMASGYLNTAVLSQMGGVRFNF